MTGSEVQPNAVDWTTILLAAITALTSIATAVLAYLASTRAGQAVSQSSQTAKAVDGLVTKQSELAEAKGNAEGKAEVLERIAPPGPGL